MAELRNSNLGEIEARIDYKFHNINTLRQAFVHISYINEHSELTKADSNQRMEFLGDSILELTAREYLYQHNTDRMEGYLSKKKQEIVSEKDLCEIARKLKLGDYLYMSHGMDTAQSRNSNSILADTMEALICAVYLDGGMEAAKKVVIDHVLKDYLERERSFVDAKTLLQEICQKKRQTLSYVMTEASAENTNESCFGMRVDIDGVPYGSGKGPSKKKAQQAAALETLEMLGEHLA